MKQFSSVPLEFHKVSVAEWCCLAIVGSLYYYDSDISVVYVLLSGLLYHKCTLMMVPISFSCSYGHLVGYALYADKLE